MTLSLYCQLFCMKKYIYINRNFISVIFVKRLRIFWCRQIVKFWFFFVCILLFNCICRNKYEIFIRCGGNRHLFIFILKIFVFLFFWKKWLVRSRKLLSGERGRRTPGYHHLSAASNAVTRDYFSHNLTIWSKLYLI